MFSTNSSRPQPHVVQQNALSLCRYTSCGETSPPFSWRGVTESWWLAAERRGRDPSLMVCLVRACVCARHAILCLSPCCRTGQLYSLWSVPTTRYYSVPVTVLMALRPPQPAARNTRACRGVRVGGSSLSSHPRSGARVRVAVRVQACIPRRPRVRGVRLDCHQQVLLRNPAADAGAWRHCRANPSSRGSVRRLRSAVPGSGCQHRALPAC